MIIDKQMIDARLNLVGKNLERVKDKMIIPGQRSEENFACNTVGRILQAAKNACMSGKYLDPVQMMFASQEENFAGLGYNAIAQHPSRSAEDITIITAITSLIPYLAIERAMTDPEANITYENLIVKNSTTGLLREGDILIGSYKPYNLGADLSMKTQTQEVAAGTGAIINFGSQIIKNAVRADIKYTNQAGEEKTIIGRDNGEGTLLWRAENKEDLAEAAKYTFAINYEAGSVTVTGTIAADAMKITATCDAISDNTGANRLRTRPDYKTALLKAEYLAIDLESSVSAEAYHNKMMLNAIEAGMKVDTADNAFNLLKNAYISYINFLLAKNLADAGAQAMIDQPGATWIEKDISGYSLSSFNDTKNAMLDEFILDLNQQLLSACGKGLTCLAVGPIGATKLGNNKDSFVKAAGYMSEVDGYIGTYMNIPVIRHRYFDQISEAGYCNVYGLVKDPNGKFGPMAFGEYTAPVTTDAAINFNNPEQYAKSLYSYAGVKVILPQLVAAGRIKYAN